MRALCALLGALAALVSVSARAQVDDPLYPLDIGAVWEFEADSWSMMYNSTSPLHRERREVVGDTVVAGDAYRIVRVMRSPVDGAGWTPHGRCAVRVKRSATPPVIEWVPITGTCEPREQGLALSNVRSGSFQVSVVRDAITFSRGIGGSFGNWDLVEGIGPYAVTVNQSGLWETTLMTYVHIGDLEAGRPYTPGWWHDLVRLEQGDHYQYRSHAYGPGYNRTTFETWTVRGDTVVNGTVMTLVSQVEFAQAGGLVRQSLCGVTKSVSGVSTVVLQGTSCRGIDARQIWWLSNLQDVEVLPGLVRPGSSYSLGYSTGSMYRFVSFAEGIGYVRNRADNRPGTMGSANGSDFVLQYAVIGGTTYGSPLVSDEPDPAGAREALQVQPNPVVGVLRFSVDRAAPAVAEVDVLDMMGRRVLRTAVAVLGTHELDVSALPPGVYIVRATLPGASVLTQRVTKVR